MLTCRACGVEPFAWLHHVLTELPQRPDNADIDDLLPFNIQLQKAACLTAGSSPFIRAAKCTYETVIAQLPFWFDHYNDLHPHNALGYQSPREFISSQSQT